MCRRKESRKGWKKKGRERKVKHMYKVSDSRRAKGWRGEGRAGAGKGKEEGKGGREGQ